MTEPRPFRLYNTLSRTLEDFTPIRPGHVGLYVCGMTVYDHAHVGHARAMVVFDAFARYLRANGWDVTFVRNFTDVDDKIIRRAAETGEAPIELAQRFIDAFQRDAASLGLAEPDHEPRVSTSIPDILSLIGSLVDRGHAYNVEGNVWFDIESFPEYGRLSGQRLDGLRSADATHGKKHPADFALWKSAREGEPSWDSPWGAGRPGWHIECSAMARATLGATFDIHGGGIDLIFPHHENEIAQSQCGNGAHYVNYWMHNGMLVVDDGRKMKGPKGDEEKTDAADANADDKPVKMGKSLGNVFNIRMALDHFPAEALRYYYLNVHYRSSLPWNSEESLPESLAQLMRLYEARERGEMMRGDQDPDLVAKELGKSAFTLLEMSRKFVGCFDDALKQDFNSAKALSHLFELARSLNHFADHKRAKKRGGSIAALALGAFAHAAKVLGVMTMETETFHEEVRSKHLKSLGVTSEEVETLMVKRTTLRASREWAAADQARDELLKWQITVMDRPEGSTWRVQLRNND